MGLHVLRFVNYCFTSAFSHFKSLTKADDIIFFCKFSKYVKLYHIENSKTSANSVDLDEAALYESVLRNFAITQVLPFLNNPKDLDLSYKMDPDFLDFFWKGETPPYNQRNTVKINKLLFIIGKMYTAFP